MERNRREKKRKEKKKDDGKIKRPIKRRGKE